ncbi:Hypothetical predicted protein [Octopus vulgaris]|uniref:Uncharacterized protein n=1 Tax=Octopus vulgaris TaxID=6645 RepID=A0AA36AM88_OCTVU|nr:Hypothetical predicted protein [Octopus vulgaris]
MVPKYHMNEIFEKPSQSNVICISLQKQTEPGLVDFLQCETEILHLHSNPGKPVEASLKRIWTKVSGLKHSFVWFQWQQKMRLDID